MATSEADAFKVTLTSDAAYTVLLPFTNAHVIQIKVSGGEVIARLTSSHGVAQVFGVDPYACIFAKTTPFTAITLTRPAGVECTAKIVLASKAA